MKIAKIVTINDIYINNLFLLPQWFEEELDSVNKKFHSALETRDERARKRLEQLDERITELGQYFEAEKKAILKQIEERGEELARMLRKFKVS
jgi:DNA-binding protein H-NS